MDRRAPASPTPASGSAAWVVVAMIAVLVLPATLTLLTVERTRETVDPSTNPTPHGYTWSLLLYIVPLLVLGFWFLRSSRFSFQKRAFWITIAILVPLGFLLDLVFGATFFAFPNPGATLGIDVPAIGGGIPLEEFVFYTAGFIFVLLLYVWSDEYWMEAYNVPDYPAESARVERLLRFEPWSLVVGLVLVALAVTYKKLFADDPDGFPLYFTYLVAAAVIPSVGLYRAVERFINWRAFSLAFFFMLLISLMWEVTLGVPYGWWSYRDHMMMGIFIDGWTGLPLEAVVVWLVVTYTSVIVYEAVKIYQSSGRTLKDALLGQG